MNWNMIGAFVRMNWNIIGAFAAIIFFIIGAAYHFGRKVERTETKLKELDQTVTKHASKYDLIVRIEERLKSNEEGLRSLDSLFYRDMSERGRRSIQQVHSESYLISSRGEAVIPDENKKQIQTFIKGNKHLLDKSVHQTTYALSSAVDLAGILNGIISKLPNKIDLPTELAFGILTAYVEYIVAETLTEQAYELIAEGKEGEAKSEVAKATKHYEEIYEIKKATKTHVNFAEKLFDRGNYGWSESQYYYGAIILIKNILLKEAAEIMEEAGKRFDELQYGKGAMIIVSAVGSGSGLEQVFLLFWLRPFFGWSSRHV